MNFKRWYGSIVRTGDEKLIIIGGTDLIAAKPSFIPEILDLKNIDNGWKVLKKASSKKLFGEPNLRNHEWYYPRSYLASDGNIVGISYNKIWVMDKDDEYRVKQTNEIKLVSGGIMDEIVDKNPNHNHKNHNTEKLKILTMGSPVGHKNATVMVGKDIVYVFGGKQKEDEYSSTNKVLKINFNDSNNPKVSEIGSLIKPRKDANATILPDGKVLLNGGTAYEDLKFSIFDAEIYDPINESSKLMSKGFFRRNYHSSSLLLPNGTILVSGGDVWNSEIFYPPYLFKRIGKVKLSYQKDQKLKN